VLSVLEQRVKFYPLRGLSQTEKDGLWDIPGLRQRGTLDAPFSAAFIVEDYLRDRKIPFRVDWTPSDSVGDPWFRIKKSEVNASVVDDFLLPFQLRTIYRACAMDSAHIWAPPGSGKTLMALCFALSEHGGVLVITSSPLTVLEQWRREVERFTKGLEPFVYRAPSKRRKGGKDSLKTYLQRKARDAERPFVIAGWAMLREHWQDLAAMRYTTIIFDESHLAKQKKRDEWVPLPNGGIKAVAVANTSRAAFELAKRAKRRLACTATPIPNQVWTDLWGQLTLIEPYAWGRTARRFERRYCNGHSGDYGWVCDKVTRADELRKRLSFSAIRVPYEVSHAELPPKRRQVVYIDPSDQVPSAASAKGGLNLKRELKDALKKGDASRLLELRLLDAAGRKRGVLKDMIKDRLGEQGKIIVFTGRREDCAKLGESLQTSLKKRLKLDDTSAPRSLWVASGEVSQKERLAIMDEYMAHPGPCVLVGTYQAWGTSLNLQDTDTLIFGMLPYTPGMLEQAEGRVHRLGMKRPVTLVYLVCEGTVDETIADKVLSKLASSEKIVAGGGLSGLGDALSGLADKEAILASMMSRLDKGAQDD
jgi:SNF2 family DNA or RNA helicase